MTTARITLHADHILFTAGDESLSVPIGTATLLGELRHDPPWAEELTNAVGAVVDHMEDVEREAPGVVLAERVEMAGGLVTVVADVEVGGTATLPFALSREAAEDVFRTLVTEHSSDRALNPGLPADAVGPVLGTVCAIVGVMRFLQLAHLWLVGG